MTAPDSNVAAATSPQSFAALRHPGYRFYFVAMGLTMMADSIEHVISYWMIFHKFHMPELGGFAIIAHWLPFLLFSVYAGALADRFDPRRIIQFGLFLFMIASFLWGVLFVTETLEMWHAVALLVIHGFAGIFWAIPGQLLIHDIVKGPSLPSAVRLMATSRVLGLLLGPAIGGGLMIAVGPSVGILINVLIYLPLMLWLWKAPYGPKFRARDAAPAPTARGFADVLQTIKAIAGNRTIVSMTVLAGAASLIVGNAHHAQMPEFSVDLGAGDSGLFYSILFGANAAGALVASFVLETTRWLRARPGTVFALVVLWCVAMAGFAMAEVYWLALALLIAAGFLELSFGAIAMMLVQLQAPAPIRGRVIGLYNMSFNGLRAFSGVTIGIGGGLIGIHWSLGLSAAALFAVASGLAFFALRPRPAAAPAAGE